MAPTTEPYDPVAASTQLVCRTCGTQFPSADRSTTKSCHICDDPRQYVPPTGQSFTTLGELQASHRNVLTPYAGDARVTFIESSPKIGIGQRAAIIRTPAGNVLWDCLTLLDDETVAAIRGLGGLAAMVISHPHYYSTHAHWARAFGCPVYVAAEDEGWATAACAHRRALTDVDTEIVEGSGARAIKLGGHFPGSLVLLFDGRLFIADTLVTTPSGVGDWAATGGRRPAGHNTFSFLWSIPNMIPLSADELSRMWDILGRYDFTSTHGAFRGMDIEDERVKERVLESMQIQVRYMGGGDHALMKVTV